MTTTVSVLCAVFNDAPCFRRALAQTRPADDTDWVSRATQLGHRHVTQPETLLMRRVHASNISTTMPLGKSLVLGMLRGAIARNRGGDT